MCIAESLCCVAEIGTTLQISSTITIKKLKKKSVTDGQITIAPVFKNLYHFL